jgi:hypothetical protein
MNSNYRRNKTAIEKYRKELRAMFNDIRDIDIKVLNKAVGEGIADAKRNTPIGHYSRGRVGGFMRRSWAFTPTTKSRIGVEKGIVNTADYSSFVNFGHRIVNKFGETIGWVKGLFILEKAIHKVDRALEKEFKKEVERVNKKHDK